MALLLDINPDTYNFFLKQKNWEMETKKEPTRIEAKDGAKGTHAHVTIVPKIKPSHWVYLVWSISLNHIKEKTKSFATNKTIT